MNHFRTAALAVIALLSLFLAAPNSKAQSPLQSKAQTPDTTIRFTDYLNYAGISTYRTLDYFSTRRALTLGGHEEILPNFVVKNPPVFVAFEGLATAGEVYGSVWLIQHRHRKLARFENYVSIGLGSAVVARNYYSFQGHPNE